MRQVIMLGLAGVLAVVAWIALTPSATTAISVPDLRRAIGFGDGALQERLFPNDDAFRDSVFLAIARTEVSSTEHGGMLRALEGPLSDATIYLFEDQSVGDLRAFSHDNAVLIGQATGWAASEDRTITPEMQAWQDRIEAGFELLMQGHFNRADLTATIAQARALAADDPTDRELFSVQRHAGSVAFVVRVLDAGGPFGVGNRYWLDFSLVADRCVPQDEERVLYARFLCETVLEGG